MADIKKLRDEIHGCRKRIVDETLLMVKLKLRLARELAKFKLGDEVTIKPNGTVKRIAEIQYAGEGPSFEVCYAVSVAGGSMNNWEKVPESELEPVEEES